MVEAFSLNFIVFKVKSMGGQKCRKSTVPHTQILYPSGYVKSMHLLSRGPLYHAPVNLSQSVVHTHEPTKYQ